MLVDRICGSCRRAFLVKSSYAAQLNRGLFCSRQCLAASRRQRPEACQRCDKPLAVSGATRKYCSHECYAAAAKGVPRPHSEEHGKAISAAKRGVPNPARRKPREAKKCRQCARTFELSNSLTISYRNARRFCSTACWYEHVRSDVGNSPTYRGGYGPLFGPDWPEHARRARVRDTNTCQDCGLVQEFPLLDVHHVVPRRAFGGDWRAANALDNLVSLCKRCHTKRERLLDYEYARRFASH